LANFFYSKAKEKLFFGNININSNQFKALLIDNSLYTPSQSSDQFVSDIPGSAIKKRSDVIQNLTCSLGIVDADDLVISDYDGSAFNSVVIYQVGSNDSNSILLFYIDTANGLPFPGSSSSSPVTIIWDNGSNKIIAI
jgi:hypothetical protein